MYPHKEKADENWSYYTASGFKRLKKILNTEKKAAETIAVIGIGSGVEGILATKIFQPTLKKLIITDIDAEVVESAAKNIRKTTRQNIEIIPLVGSYCEPLEKATLGADVIYGNIPNLPSSNDIDLSRGAEKGTFVPTSLYENYKPPGEFVVWAMGSQFAFLQSAKKVLSENGSVVTALGGRMPLKVVNDLFAQCKLNISEILVGFKVQTEALIDFQGYYNLEKEHSISFEFYPYHESTKILKEKVISNPSNNTNGEDLKKLLDPLVITAGRAIELYGQKVGVGHTVHLFRGTK